MVRGAFSRLITRSSRRPGCAAVAVQTTHAAITQHVYFTCFIRNAGMNVTSLVPTWAVPQDRRLRVTHLSLLRASTPVVCRVPLLRVPPVQGRVPLLKPSFSWRRRVCCAAIPESSESSFGQQDDLSAFVELRNQASFRQARESLTPGRRPSLYDGVNR